MHEFSIAEALTEALLARAGEWRGQRVTAVRIRRGSAISEAALQAGFRACARGTLLAQAALVVETVTTTVRCRCGQAQAVTSDDLIGHSVWCPACGTLTPVEALADLELLDVTLIPAHADLSA